MKHAGILVLCILFTFRLAAQVTISGTITDSLTGQPVANANIVLKGTIQGSTTNESGNFKIRVNGFPVHLIISEIRYHTTEFVISEKNPSLRLAPKTQMIQGITVQEKRIQNIHPDKRLYAFDFEFYDDYILVLACEKNKKNSQLLLLSDNGDLILSKKLAITPEGFYRDFMGNVHLISSLNAYQIYYDFEEIHLLYAMPKWEFMATMYQCKAEYNGSILIMSPQYRGLVCIYYAVGKDKKNLFYMVSDSSKRTYLEREFDLKYFLDLRNGGAEPFMVSVKTLRENLDYYRQMVAYDWLDGKILAPVNAPLYKIDDSIYIFDYTHSEVIQFDTSLAQKRKIPIEFHQNKRWNNRILIDDTWQDIYTCYVRDGITQITRLDKTSFNPVEVSEINGMIYIDKLKIRNGHAYFLHKNQFRNYNRMIYKMVL